MSGKAIFFDRDGVINRDYGYVGSIESFEFLPDVPQTLGQLKDLGYKLVLITNQSGIAIGKYTEADFYAVTDFMQQELSKFNASFDAIYFCPHHPEAQILQYRQICSCRKPNSGLFFKALNELKLKAENCIALGDQPRDLLAAYNAGIRHLYLCQHKKVESLGTISYELLPSLSLLPKMLTH